MVSIGGVTDAARTTALDRALSLPGPVLRRLAGAPLVVDGRTLHPEMQLLLRLQRLDGPAPETLPISRGRRVLDAGARATGGRPPIGAVTDRTIDGPGGPLRLRFYTPRGLVGAAPALVYLHGGGFMYGGLDSHDALCRTLSERAQVRVVAIDYRLAPEHPFPAAFDDALAGWSWVAAHATGLGIDPSRLAIGGDSAGGNLAAAVTLATRRHGVAEPAFQLLIYPTTDMSRTYPSEEKFGEGLLLTTQFIELARDSYLVGDEDLTDPRLSPLHGDHAGSPPAHVVTAGFDPLLDEGAALVAALEQAGVPVDHHCEERLIHGFANLVGVGRVGPQAVGRVAVALTRGLS